MSILFEVHVEDAVNTTGYLVIDSLVAGGAHGGLRIAHDVTAERLRGAARTMTLKYGWAGLPVGGAKAGLLMPPDTSEIDRALMLRAFGRAIEPYLRTGRYVPGEDMGSSMRDIKMVLAAAGVKPKPRSLMFTASGMYTGVGVCAAGLAVADSLEMPIRGMSVSIEGFGNVGASAARCFHEAEAKVIAISTQKGGLYNENGLDIPELSALRRRLGDEVVLRREFGDLAPPSLLAVPADVYCPCAEMHTITAQNMSSLQARVVCPGANVPATEEAEDALTARGVLLVPDFVANCGGVLGSSMSRAGLGREEITSIIHRRLYDQTAMLVLNAREQKRTLREVATESAAERFAQAKQRYEQKSPSQSFMRIAVRVYRSGIIPPPLLAPLGRRYYGVQQT